MYPEKQPLHTLPLWAEPLPSFIFNHHTSLLSQNLCSPLLPHFNSQSSLVKTWVLFQRCMVALIWNIVKPKVCITATSPTWSSPILTVFPDISLLFCPSGMCLQAVPLGSLCLKLSLAFSLPFLFLEYMRDLCINTHYSFAWNTFSKC